MHDSFGRRIDYLRLSLTERCGLSCLYCNPDGCRSRARELASEDIIRLARMFAACGIRHIRLTGGEPLERADAVYIAERIKRTAGIETVSITTNGLKLADTAAALKAAGVDRVNVSLDSLRGDVFRRITGADGLDRVLAGIDAAYRAGLKLRINMVPMRGINEADIIPIAGFARDRDIDVRYIEYMPMNGGGQGICNDEIKAMAEAAFGRLEKTAASGGGPAEYYRVNGFKGRLGFISALSHRFCGGCNRIRLTSEGFLKLCLCYDDGIDLRGLLKSSDAELAAAIVSAVKAKPQQHDFETNKNEHTEKMWRFGG